MDIQITNMTTGFKSHSILANYLVDNIEYGPIILQITGINPKSEYIKSLKINRVCFKHLIENIPNRNNSDSLDDRYDDVSDIDCKKIQKMIQDEFDIKISLYEAMCTHIAYFDSYHKVWVDIGENGQTLEEIYSLPEGINCAKEKR